MQSNTKMKNEEIDNLLEKFKKDNIRHVRFEAPNMNGVAIGMLVPARNAEFFLRNGFPFCTMALLTTVNNDFPLEDFAKVRSYIVFYYIFVLLYVDDYYIYIIDRIS